MKILGPDKTARLLERLISESRDYYQTLHDAKASLQMVDNTEEGYQTMEDVFIGLQEWRERLKRRFTVMAYLSEPHGLSDEVAFWSNNCI